MTGEEGRLRSATDCMVGGGLTATVARPWGRGLDPLACLERGDLDLGDLDRDRPSGEGEGARSCT